MKRGHGVKEREKSEWQVGTWIEKFANKRRGKRGRTGQDRERGKGSTESCQATERENMKEVIIY